MSKLTHRALRKEMLAALMHIKSNGPVCGGNGICYNVELRMGWNFDIQEIQRELFATWDRFSGNLSYPIRGFKGLLPENAFYATGEGGMWSKRTRYGKDRWLLLDHMITQLEIQLSKT